MDVLVYSGRGVCPLALQLTLASLRQAVGQTHTVRAVGPALLAAEPWEPSCRLLVVPGGRDLPYVEELGGAAAERIGAYVRAGGAYLGLCAGAYFACARVDFDAGGPLQVAGARPLGLFGRVVGRGPVHSYSYEGHVSARAERLVTAAGPVAAYYNGGGTFDDPAAELATVLAHYADGQPAVVSAAHGRGRVLLSGPHIEYAAADLPDAGLPFPVDELRRGDAARRALWHACLAQLGLHVDEAPRADTPTALRVFARGEPGALPLGRAEQTTFVASDDPAAVPTADTMPVVSGGDAAGLSFDPARFYALLAGTRLGHTLLYAERIHSTQTLLTANPAFSDRLRSGTVCLAGDQLAGKGRGANTWLSSTGCLQFTLVLDHDPAAGSLSIIQYLVATAMAEAVLRTLGTRVRIKWPNDMYALVDGAPKKLGGILVNSTSTPGGAHRLFIGFGFNVHSTPWAASLSDIAGRRVDKEPVLAAFLDTLDALHTRMAAERAFPFSTYYQHWLHTDDIVWLEEEQCQARIDGIDKDGFLVATPLPAGAPAAGPPPAGLLAPTRRYLLQPDGNSFDLMKKLIRRKQ